MRATPSTTGGTRKPRPPHQRRSGAFPFLVMGMIGLGMVALVAGFLSPRFFSDPPVADYVGEGTGSVIVVVNPGDTLYDVALQMTNSGVTASASAFTRAAANNEAATGLQPGTYELRQQMSGEAALALILDPASRQVSGFTIPEGSRMTRVFTIASEATGIPIEEFQAVVENPVDLGLPAWSNGNPEGFLYPARYEFQPDSTALSLMQQMVAKFNEVAATINFEAEAQAQGRDPYDVLITASLVEAEGGVEDFGKVARVVLNRLDQGMPLQFDSTSNYASDSSNIQLTPEQLQEDTPYNSYLYQGLPPTPINQPGEAAMQASLFPEEGTWIFFVSVNPDTKETRFTDDYDEFLGWSDELLRYLATRPPQPGEQQ
jgi:UPF0755 protein